MALDGGLVRLRQAQPLAPSERKIADVILGDPGAFLKMTLAELATASNSSQAAVVRLWRTLDFAGFHDLKLRVAGDYQRESSQDSRPYEEIGQSSSAETVMKLVLERSVRGIEDTMSLNDPAALESAADALLGARRICVFGVGASAEVAGDMASKLLRIGMMASGYDDFHGCAVFATQLTQEDVLIAISYSGQTTDTTEIAQIAKRRGARIITLTQYSRNPVRELGDISLYVSVDESVIRAAAMTSRLTSLVVMDVLFTAVASRKFEESIGILNETRDAVSSHRKREPDTEL